MRYPIAKKKRVYYIIDIALISEKYNNYMLCKSYPQRTKGHTVGEEPIFAPASLLSFRVRPLIEDNAENYRNIMVQGVCALVH